jgi:uncharacterized delta-60 repeat protein
MKSHPLDLSPSQTRCLMLIWLVALIAAASSTPSLAAHGDIDSTFSSAANVYSVTSTIAQLDGKIVVSGFYRLTRVNANGAVDVGFATGDNDGVHTTAVQLDGKILVGGEFDNLGAETRYYIARLNPNGTIDPTFNANIDGSSKVYVRCILPLADGRYLVTGTFDTVNGQSRRHIARLHADGSLDTTFNVNVSGTNFGFSTLGIYSAAQQPDGKILLAGRFSTIGPVPRANVARLNADGSTDMTFRFDIDNVAYAIAQQADGKIVIGGEFGMAGGVPREAIARCDQNGNIDTTFNANIVGPGIAPLVVSMALQTDGRILISGLTASVGGLNNSNVARINADGTVDPTFNCSTSHGTSSVVLQTDGKAIIGGIFDFVNNQWRRGIARLQNDPAAHVLSVPEAGTVRWLRSGTSPEVQRVAFELSTDGGTTYTPLGAAGRIAGGWELVGLNLPAVGIVRARAFVQSGNSNASSGWIEEVVSYPPAPGVVATAPTNISTTGATLNASINANGTTTTARFEYGLTTQYGQTAQLSLSPSDGVTPVSASASISGLTPHTTYRYRVVATNLGGTTATTNGSFLTANTSPLAPSLDPGTILENEPVGTVVGVLGAAVDADNDAVTYTLVTGAGSTDNAHFTIDGNVLKTAASFDFESSHGPEYLIRVRAADAFGGNTTTALVVGVTDVRYPQTIQFAPAATAIQTDRVLLSASATGGGTVTFEVVNGPGVIVDGVLIFTGSGAVTIRASQPGGPESLPAPDVEVTISVAPNRGPVLADDAVTLTRGDATIHPLANDIDPDGDELRIVAVSDPEVSIRGRELVIPADFVGTFTYTAADPYDAEQTATVTVISGAPEESPNKWHGLLFDASGTISGIMRANRSASGMVTVRFTAGTMIAAKKLRLAPLGSATTATPAGTLTMKLDTDGRLAVNLGALAGRLRPCPTVAGIQRLHLALASIDTEIPGGGTAVFSVGVTGAVAIIARLPDGTVFSTQSQLADNGSLAIHAVLPGTNLDGVVSGECLMADLSSTDVTGELSWVTPPKEHGPHATGVNTVLTLNGCRYTRKSVLPSGPVIISATGGDLAAPLTVATVAVAGVPQATPEIFAWRADAGIFTARVRVAEGKSTVARGLYLPKSNSAWGWFRGTFEGGRIAMSAP